MTKKVTIEVTEKGWETKVELNGKTYFERHKRTEFGSEGYEGNFDYEDDISDELADALGGFQQSDIMRSLENHF